MEFVALKKNRNRKRKRNVKNRRRERRKLEVKGTSRRKTLTRNISAMRDESRSHTMDANTFWDNYKLAQDWQQRHSVAWWKSRCHALEHENNVLRRKILDRASHRERRTVTSTTKTKTELTKAANDRATSGIDDESEYDDDENLEFQVDKDMMDFLEQSIRHKIELKRSRELENAAASALANADTPFVTCEARIIAKTKDARLLYGEASPGIMAMEAALQATIDRHKDRANPQYWPNIPLKP